MLREILSRNRWFFAKMTGRRRIGKTTLIQHAIQASSARPVYYVQIPDSGPAGVLSAVGDALASFRVPAEQFPRPRTLGEFAKLIYSLVRANYVVVLDEFQYFNRAAIAILLISASRSGRAISTGRASARWTIVLGSIHTEMMAILEDRSAPLYNRVTDEISLTHLDIASILEILRQHADPTPERLLFLWTLFEGVPKFYRDCYEQEVLRKSPVPELFEGSSLIVRHRCEPRQIIGSFESCRSLTLFLNLWRVTAEACTMNLSPISRKSAERVRSKSLADTSRF